MGDERLEAWVDGGILDPDGAMDRLAAWKGRIDRLASDTKAMSDRLQDLRATATDPNGLAEVTVDASGNVVDLRLGQRIQRVAPEVTARAIMTTIQAARGEIAARSQQVIADTMGTESPAAREIAERVGRQLRDKAGASAPEERGGWR